MDLMDSSSFISYDHLDVLKITFLTNFSWRSEMARNESIQTNGDQIRADLAEY